MCATSKIEWKTRSFTITRIHHSRMRPLCSFCFPLVCSKRTSIDAIFHRDAHRERERERMTEHTSSSSHRTCQRNLTLIPSPQIPNVFELFGHDTMSKIHHQKIPFVTLNAKFIPSLQRNRLWQKLIEWARLSLKFDAYSFCVDAMSERVKVFYHIQLSFFYQFACLLTLAFWCVRENKWQVGSDETRKVE